jgi:UDP-N-acetylmuramyl pentapeptide phosphotransferase/UDP-N-acetylglucosamine-1-phosphate transferase
MSYILLAFAIAAVLTYLAIPVIINVANEKKLFDIPDDRKIHKTLIPSLGGIGIFGGFIIAALLLWPTQSATSTSTNNMPYITAACLIIFFLGLKDDLLVISPLKKFIGQLIAAWIIVYKCGLLISSFQGVFGITTLPHAAALGITYLAIVLIINAFNLIDGIDGLSGHLGLICCLCFAIYFFSHGMNFIGYAIIAAAMAGALASFLVFNHHPAKIFMGDTGSMLLGLICSILLIKFISISNPDNIEIVKRLSLKGGPIVAVSFLIIPLFDTVRVFGRRILNGRSPFSPDRTHIHHLLLDKGFTHNRITLILSLASILLIGITLLSNLYVNATITLLILLLSTTAFFAVAYFLPKKKAQKIVKKKDGSTNSRIVNIARDAVM